MVELAIVAAMIAILAAMAVPVARYSLRRQKELELRYQLRMMRDAIDKYKQISDAGLIPLEVGGEGYPARPRDAGQGRQRSSARSTRSTGSCARSRSTR